MVCLVVQSLTSRRKKIMIAGEKSWTFSLKIHATSSRKKSYNKVILKYVFYFRHKYKYLTF